jgi:hypothetical protein
MADEAKNAAEELANNTNAEVIAEAKQEETIGETINPEKKEPKVVPEATFLELKNANKELKKDLKELKQLIESGGSKKEVSSDLKAIAEEHNVDAEFLSKFAESIESKANKDIDEKISAKLKPLEEKERQTKIDSIFEDKFAKAIEAMPEYKDIANKDVIKSLSLDPNNANKTWKQIIEGAYGHLITGRKTMETSKPGSGKNSDQDVDIERAGKDTAYFKEVMANPELKKKYNAELTSRLRI